MSPVDIPPPQSTSSTIHPSSSFSLSCLVRQTLPVLINQKLRLNLARAASLCTTAAQSVEEGGSPGLSQQDRDSRLQKALTPSPGWKETGFFSCSSMISLKKKAKDAMRRQNGRIAKRRRHVSEKGENP